MANGKRKMIGPNGKKFLEGASQNCQLDTNVWTQQNNGVIWYACVVFESVRTIKRRYYLFGTNNIQDVWSVRRTARNAPLDQDGNLPSAGATDAVLCTVESAIHHRPCLCSNPGKAKAVMKRNEILAPLKTKNQKISNRGFLVSAMKLENLCFCIRTASAMPQTHPG